MKIFTFIPLTAACLCSLSAGASNNSPYISKVYEYCPAPGQFVNEIPEYEEGDTYETMLQKANEQLVGDRMPGMITLGAWGGYVVFGFDHPVMNKAGEYDFKIYGNALISDRDKKGGSSEPGIVMVSIDINGNGLPDDPWYELAGSEYTNPSTKKGYEVTYSEPEASHTPTPDPNDKNVIDTTYIPWTSNDTQNSSGYITRNTSHLQYYWPQWISENTMTFSGTRLPANAEDISGNGSYLLLHFFDWGYADNLPNSEEKGFNIEWAVDNDGKPVKIESIDFIKVYTAVQQNCGRLGESSTEIAGAEDLHPDLNPLSLNSVTETDILLLTSRDSCGMTVRTDRDNLPYTLFSSNGIPVITGTLHTGENHIDISALSAGIYILRTQRSTLTFIK